MVFSCDAATVSLDTLFPLVMMIIMMMMLLFFLAENYCFWCCCCYYYCDVAVWYDMETITWLGKHSIQCTTVVILIATYCSLTFSFLGCFFFHSLLWWWCCGCWCNWWWSCGLFEFIHWTMSLSLSHTYTRAYTCCFVRRTTETDFLSKAFRSTTCNWRIQLYRNYLVLLCIYLI